jgi:hypothetical protein
MHHRLTNNQAHRTQCPRSLDRSLPLRQIASGLPM